MAPCPRVRRPGDRARDRHPVPLAPGGETASHCNSTCLDSCLCCLALIAAAAAPPIAQETGEPAQLYMVHGHYADGGGHQPGWHKRACLPVLSVCASSLLLVTLPWCCLPASPTGEVAACMSLTLGIPMALTGHSLGRNKREHLLKGGAMTGTEIEAVYRMSRWASLTRVVARGLVCMDAAASTAPPAPFLLNHRRIEAEERALGAATVVFASTQQEASSSLMITV